MRTCENGIVELGGMAGNRSLYGAMVVLLALAMCARAGNVGVSLKAGTPGFGADVTVGLAEKVNIRAGINAFSVKMDPSDDEEDDDDEDLSLELNLLTAPLMLDWHPFRNNFRLTAGAMWNGNRLSLTADAGDTVELNDRSYAVEDLAIDVAFNPISPYLGIGYGNAARRGRRVVFALDIGVMYHGTPKLEAKSTAANPAQQAALDRDLDAEVEDFRDDLRAFTLYPVVTLGLTFRF